MTVARLEQEMTVEEFRHWLAFFKIRDEERRRAQ